MRDSAGAPTARRRCRRGAAAAKDSFVVISSGTGSGEESFDVCCERGGGDPEGADPGAGGEELPAGA